MIRPATPADVPELLAMISELAAYNKAPDAAVATADQLHEALFGEHPAVFAHLATEPGEDGGPHLLHLDRRLRDLAGGPLRALHLARRRPR
jgi:hypothetical protein